MARGSAIYSINNLGIEDGPETILAYVYPDEQTRTLYLLCLGQAEEKDSDMEYCKTAVLSLVNNRN